MDLPHLIDVWRDPPWGAREAVVSSRAFYFSGEDHLRVTSFGSVASVVLSVEGRFLTPEGAIEVFAERHVPNSDRTSASTLFSRGPGWLLDCQVRASAGTPRRGQVFVLLEVVRGLSGGVTPHATLLQGYVTDTSRLAFPGSLHEAMSSGRGALRSITGTNPGAGAEVSETVPTNARWRPHAFQVTLVSSSVAANREVALVFDDGATAMIRVPSGVSHVASTTLLYSAFHHAPRNTVAQDTARNLPLPRVDLQGGSRVTTVTANIDPLDNYGAPQLLVEEWTED